MTTPSHYHRSNLKQILGKDKYFLYHFTTIQCARSILNDGYLYSKAMLFGLHYYDNPHLLRRLKRHDVLTEAKNGFINYVFLGNTNWLEFGDSYYGDVCFVIKPEGVLLTREFFVFPFNTGRDYSVRNDEDKTCDTRTLIDALNHKHPCFEILVRRRIQINDKIISKIICPDEHRGEIQNHLQFCQSKIKVERPDGMHNMRKQESIELVDPVDTEKNKLIFKENEYIRHKDRVYVKTKYSNCTLSLIVSDFNELIDPNTKKTIGKVINKQDELKTNGPYLEP